MANVEPPRPHLQNPIAGTTIDTNPDALGVGHHRKSSKRRSRDKPSTVKRDRSVDAAATDAPDHHPAHFGSLSRPPLVPFRGDGSIHAGTQTLIQALQAIPWEDDPDNLDEPLHEYDERDSDDESNPPDDIHSHSRPQPLSSSIHTIYRPLARSKRATPIATDHPAYPFPDVHPPSDVEEEADSDIDFEEESEEATQRVSSSDTVLTRNVNFDPKASPDATRPAERRAMSRSKSLATVKATRRARLAEKLREIFDLQEIDEVIAEMPCWLLRSVLLQGYMYMTNSHLCFFAHIPSREDQVIKSGTLTKKTTRTRRWVRRWFVLRNDALTWYQSSSDPYFPHGVVDLRYAVACEAVGEKDINIRTNQKNVLVSADSITSRDEWVKAIRKVIFKAQNNGESVKIGIPYSVIVDVERSSALGFSETIEVKVLDSEDHLSLESYFFAYFHDINDALQQIRDILSSHRHETEQTAAVKDTTMKSHTRPTSQDFEALERTQSSPLPAVQRSSRIGTFFKAFANESAPAMVHNTSAPEVPTAKDNGKTAELADITTSPSMLSSELSSSSFDHTYPPSPSPPAMELHQDTSWGVSVPSWLKGSSLKSLAARSLPTLIRGRNGQVSEVYTASPAPMDPENSREFTVIDAQPDTGVDPDDEEKFRHAFAMDERETLLECSSGYLLRVLPVLGKFYISSSFLCFKSSQPLVKTKMILPIRDVLSAQKCRPFQFNCHGLLLVIKGHEELFFEFKTAARREHFMEILEKQVDMTRTKTQDVPNLKEGARDALILEELEYSELPIEDPQPPPDTGIESLPAVMFASTSSTFLTFKPPEPLHFTFLSIGSRGDVQPYIALGKGLMADGHRVKIATHEEYKDWILSHGMEFSCVGGDPAELMRICVENGMFTVSFLRETLSKFRGWLDDLLKSSWEACQGTDVLIESPSAMGGIHIAEALKIPYYRAFTMPWTRTRAYPHAFAVPDHKMGGGYNYMSYVMFDQVFWRSISGQINRWRRDCLGIGPTTLDLLEQHKVPFLYNFSPTVVPPPLDWYEWIRITGYWFLQDADVSGKKWDPPASLVKFINEAHTKGKKVVYIGFGSIVVSDPTAMTECIVEAIVESDVYAVLSKGWSDRLQATKTMEEEVGRLPPQIYQIKSIPHDWLFPRVDAACHHGGAGTTGASLRAGIPTIIKPFFGDQFFWSDRVEALGVGSKIRKLTVQNLSAALITATTDQKQIDKAKLVGETIRAENGVATAIEAIYRDLEYARTLVKQVIDDADDAATIAGKKVPDIPALRSLHKERRLSQSIDSSNGSKSAPSDDWSVISDEDGQALGKSAAKRLSVANPLVFSGPK